MNYWSVMEDTGANRSLLPREIQPGVLVCPDPAEVARAAARFFVDWAWQAIARDGHFNVALSGGNTPRDLYRLLATSEFRAQVDWPRVHLFWGDERAVPPDHPESNYAMVRRELLLRVPIPAGNVHRMKAEDPILGKAAHEYETILRRCLPIDNRGFPIFDLILLGLGGDGHVASLFPESAFLRETSHWVSTPMVAKLGMRRMSLTLPVLEAARRILFLVTGAGKAAILKKVLSEPGERPLPAQMAVSRDGDRTFLADEEAASLLNGGPSGRPSPPRRGMPSRGQSPRSKGDS